MQTGKFMLRFIFICENNNDNYLQTFFTLFYIFHVVAYFISSTADRYVFICDVLIYFFMGYHEIST